MPKPLRNDPPEASSTVEVLPPRTQGRRQFNAAEKRRILAAADACVHGELGALLRREGIYHSQLQTWDITKLPLVDRGLRLFLYVLIDLYSRYVVGWMVAGTENGALACRFVGGCVAAHPTATGLTVHQDRGSPMTSTRFIDLLAELQVGISHSRPRVSNDNAYSEAHFKTLKTQPDYPGRFTDTAHARRWCDDFFRWYNEEHQHSGLNG